MAGGQYAAVREYMGMAPKGGVRNDQLAAWDVLTAWVDKERVNNPDRKITNEDMQTEFGEEWEKVDWAKLTRKRTVPPALTATVTNASPAKKAKRAEEDVATEELNEQEVDLSDAINQLAKQTHKAILDLKKKLSEVTPSSHLEEENKDLKLQLAATQKELAKLKKTLASLAA